MSAGTHLNNVRWSAARPRMIGVDQGKRERDDFYPTPPHATVDLLTKETFCGPVWEPACGDGAMSRVLEAAGHRIVSSDLIDRGFGEVGIDFLLEQHLRAPTIVTNPPFRLAVPFVRHAVALGASKIAMLLKIAFLEGQDRRRLFDEHPPARVWVFSRRVAFTRGTGAAGGKVGGGMMAFAWFVWERGYGGPPTLGWLP